MGKVARTTRPHATEATPDVTSLPMQGAFSILSPQDRRELEALGRWRRFARDDVLIHHGASDQHVLILAGGRVKVLVTTRGGQEVLLTLRGPGDVLGDIAAVDGRPRSASVVALEPVRALQIPGTAFLTFLHGHPDLLLALLRTVADRLREANHRLVDLAVETTETRLARQLLWLLGKSGIPTEDGIALGIPLSQAELAASIGASREAVNHVLGRLRSAGVIQTRPRQLTVTDLAGLRESAGLFPPP